MLQLVLNPKVSCITNHVKAEESEQLINCEKLPLCAHLAPTKAERIAAFEQPQSCHVSLGGLRVVHQGGNRHSPGGCGSQHHCHGASRGVAGGRGVYEDYLRC